jgi:hypothetical protein
MSEQKPRGAAAVIACEVMRPELEFVCGEKCGIDFYYMEQSLHLTPNKMAARIQKIIDEITGTKERIILGYGLCSNGLVGVKSRLEELIVPRCHDCISFFLGSPQTYMQDFSQRPGSYYLTPGWILEKKDPYHIMTNEYIARYGKKNAEWAMREELKHYTHVVLIDTGLYDIEPLRRIGKQNADYFGLEYLELPGTGLKYFHSLIRGPYDDQNFIVLEPGGVVKQDLFF